MVTKKQIQEMMKDNFVEMNGEEYFERSASVGDVLFATCEDGDLYFKIKQKFPIIIENTNGHTKIYSNGKIEMYSVFGRRVWEVEPHRIERLEEVIKQAKEIRNK